MRKPVLQIVPKRDPITNDWTVLRVAKEYMPPTWEKVFQDAMPELEDISNILEEKEKEARIVPNKDKIFNAFWCTQLNKVKVVLVAQDPYQTVLPNGNPQAMGLAFSVPRDAPIPPSLVNIYKELKNTVEGFRVPSHGDLTKWTREGVLLVNISLTTCASIADAHKGLWEGFIKKIVKTVLDVNPSVIFVLWGKNAQKIKKFTGERATFLEANHPSPLSASRGFFSCNHFNKINEILVSQGKTPIDWNLD